MRVNHLNKTELKKNGGTLFVLVWIAATCAVSIAQTDRTIKIRMLDSKTGQPITTSEIEVRVRTSPSSVQAVGTPPIYIRPAKEEATFPMAVSDIRVFARDGVWGYVNCDSVKDQRPWPEHWYSISDILRSGIAAPNRCNKRTVIAKAGEFIFFVRPMTFWEKMKE